MQARMCHFAKQFCNSVAARAGLIHSWQAWLHVQLILHTHFAVADHVERMQYAFQMTEQNCSRVKLPLS